jgi:hypothetical protein
MWFFIIHLQIVGAPCGQHGSYTFYKAFKYSRRGITRILSLSDFFFVKISSIYPVSIGELQLIWTEKNSDVLLCSLRLYFLPENTPDGRAESHGQVRSINCVLILHCNTHVYHFITNLDFFNDRESEIVSFRIKVELIYILDLNFEISFCVNFTITLV